MVLPVSTNERCFPVHVHYVPSGNAMQVIMDVTAEIIRRLSPLPTLPLSLRSEIADITENTMLNWTIGIRESNNEIHAKSWSIQRFHATVLHSRLHPLGEDHSIPNNHMSDSNPISIGRSWSQQGYDWSRVRTRWPPLEPEGDWENERLIPPWIV
jgi:hypothetical protein